MLTDFPFEFTKEQLDKFCFNGCEIPEESTHDSQITNPSRSGVSSKFTLSPTSGELQVTERLASDIKFDKLMEDLAFIDQPLSTKRLR